MSPGAEELAVGRPFVGASGKVLAAAMLQAGLKPSMARILNVINCPPAGGVKDTLRVGIHDFVNGNRITADQLKACSPRFEKELKGCSCARVIVTLGTEAFHRVTGIKGKISQWQCHPVQASACGDLEVKKGMTLPSCLPPQVEWVVPLYHPAYVMYRGNKDFPALVAGFQHARDLLEGKVKMLHVDGAGFSMRNLRKWKATGPIAFDIETEGFDGPINRMGLALTTADGVVSGSFPWTPEVIQETARLLATPRVPKVAHNAAFDIPRLERYGIKVEGPIFDTMWAHQLLQPELEKSLAAVSGFVLRVPPWKHTSHDDPGWYNRMDAFITHQLFEPLTESLDRDGMGSLFRDTIMPVLRTLINMSARGIRVDLDRVTRWRDELGTQSTTTYAEISKLLESEINLNSAKQMIQLIYEDLGYPKQYNKERVTADRTALEKLLRMKPGDKCKACKGKGTVVIQRQPAGPCSSCAGSGRNHIRAKGPVVLHKILEYRKAVKLHGTYAKLSGTVHPSYFPVGKDDSHYGTATGRLSSADPNIQNQPPQAKMMYVPRPGMVFLELDYSQVELRLAAYMSKCPALIDIFESGKDIHAENMKVLRCDRTRAKNVVYGTMYGAGARKLYETLLGYGFETSIKECSMLQNAFFEAYPELLAWREETLAFARKNHFVRNPFGRRRYFYQPDRAVPAILNFLPQSTTGDIILDRLNPVADAFLKNDGALLTTVHDSFMGEVPREHWKQTARTAQRRMHKRYSQIHPKFWCPADIKLAMYRWGRGREVKLATA